MTKDNFNYYAHAKAIFSLAMQQNNLSAWDNFLQVFVRIIHFNAVTAYCYMPQQRYGVPIGSKSSPLDFFIAVFADMQVVLAPEMINFIQLLLSRRRLEFIPQIYTAYQEMYADHAKTLQVKIASAQELTASERQNFIDSLTQQYGCKIELENEVVTALIGGAIIYIKDKVIDGSIAGQLQRLRSYL